MVPHSLYIGLDADLPHQQPNPAFPAATTHPPLVTQPTLAFLGPKRTNGNKNDAAQCHIRVTLSSTSLSTTHVLTHPFRSRNEREGSSSAIHTHTHPFCSPDKHEGSSTTTHVHPHPFRSRNVREDLPQRSTPLTHSLRSPNEHEESF